MLEVERPPCDRDRPPPVGRTGRVVGGREARAAHRHGARPRRRDGGRHRPRRRGDREAAAVCPAGAAQVEDRFARAVSRKLGPGAVGVEDPQLRREAIVGGAAEQQHAVGVAAEMRLADPPHALGRQLEREPFTLDDYVVVPERLPLLEPQAHCFAEGYRDARRALRLSLARQAQCGRSSLRRRACAST